MIDVGDVDSVSKGRFETVRHCLLASSDGGA
jgi:hypothetical protein